MATTSGRGSIYDNGTHYDRSGSHQLVVPTKTSAFFHNIKSIFAYKPQSQEYLYKQLFEDSDRKSMRGSLIFNHMQVVDEIRNVDSTSNYVNSP